jgi:membrane-associated phospholipid phosphatase
MRLWRNRGETQSLLRVATEFPLEWSAAAAVALVDLVWIAKAGFSFSIAPIEIAVPAFAIALGIVFRTRLTSAQGSLVTEYFALSSVTTILFGFLSYLCCAVAYPLADSALERADLALGFDWLFWFRLLMRHPAAEAILRVAYVSLLYQGLYFTVLFGLMRRKTELREMFWIVFFAGVLTAAGSVWLPALGTFKTFGFVSRGDYIPVIEHLRRGVNLHFDVSKMTGVVSFPSFHTAMAVVYCYGFRRSGIISVVIRLLNVLMLVSIPFFGGHYLVDVIAGVAVAALSIALAKGLMAAERRRLWFGGSLSRPVPV